MKNEQSLGDLSDHNKNTNTLLSQKSPKRQAGTEKISRDIMAENFPNLAENIKPQIREAE